MTNTLHEQLHNKHIRSESTPINRDSLRSGNEQPLRDPASNTESDEIGGNSLPELQNALGIADKTLILRLMAQAAGAINIGRTNEPVDDDFVATLVRGIGSKGELEGMLAVQTVATHALAMEFIRRAAQDPTNAGIDLNLSRATELLRVFVLQLEALDRHKGA